MTMMMTDSQFGLEDMEALLWGPSSPMADTMGSLLFQPDLEEEQGGGGGTSFASPLTTSSLSSSSSPPPFYSPPPSPPALLHRDKAGTELDLLSLPSLAHSGQLGVQRVSAKEDTFGDMEWMTERVDLTEFDLDSLIGSCSPAEESPSSEDDFLASLDCSVELDSLPIPSIATPSTSSTGVSPPALPPACSDHSLLPAVEPAYQGQEVPSPPMCVPEPQEELEIKSEPVSPGPFSPSVDSPCSPAYTLDLGSEVDVSECEVKPVGPSVVPQVQRIVLSLSPTRIVLVLAPKDEVAVATATVTTATPEMVQMSPASPSRSYKSRPYPDPKCIAGPPSPNAASVRVDPLRAASGGGRGTLKAPKDRKLKKMAQNKTAATRYRQKKRAEQDALLSEFSVLERKNMALAEKAESMAREIEYLKELMEEVRTTRINKGLSADP
ncbi:activating transcription factor 4b [Genypterus blacodes]|uniref:activating transcription factor 4b n=1 Tax=Genypterus blacodes TaxID=154954 RepID=UPI003F768362